MRRSSWWIVALALFALWTWQQRVRAPDTSVSPPRTTTQPGADVAGLAALPAEARATLDRIRHGGPFAHRQDGAVFQNREHRLPPQPLGYYHEYTVETPGSDDRGARRIISGGGTPGESPPVEYFYSDDHYRSFRRLQPGDVERREGGR